MVKRTHCVRTKFGNSSPLEFVDYTTGYNYNLVDVDVYVIK